MILSSWSECRRTPTGAPWRPRIRQRHVTWLQVSDASAGWLPWSGDHGDTWPSRIARLRADEPVKMQQLHQLMQQHAAWPGTPARLGWDGLAWDGHHRIATALRLGWRHHLIPVLHCADKAICARCGTRLYLNAERSTWYDETGSAGHEPVLASIGAC